MLKTQSVKEMVKGYEVEARPHWQWEIAILDGFRIFRELMKNGGGRVTAHFDDHYLEFSPEDLEE